MLKRASLLKSVVGRTGRLVGGLMRRPLYFPETILIYAIKCNVVLIVRVLPKVFVQLCPYRLLQQTG